MILIGFTILVAALVVIATDIYLLVKGGFQATLSYWVMLNSVKYPILPAFFGLVIGILIGHFFWNQLLNVTVSCPVSQ